LSYRCNIKSTLKVHESHMSDVDVLTNKRLNSKNVMLFELLLYKFLSVCGYFAIICMLWYKTYINLRRLYAKGQT